MTQQPTKDSRRTNVFFVRGDEVLLGQKKPQNDGKNHFGEGKWNGFGGKLGPSETIEQAAIRECVEECALTPTHLTKVAILDFADSYGQVVHVFICDEWQGKPSETAEMRPKWFQKSDLPWSKMWNDDTFWLPHILAGKKLKAKFIFERDDDYSGTATDNEVTESELEFVDDLD